MEAAIATPDVRTALDITEVSETATIPPPPAQKQDNHCPYGCGLDQLDDMGYCRHLAGFTNDRKTFEPVEKLIDRFGRNTGRYMVNGKKRQKVLDSDMLVNPIKTDSTGRRWLSWVSARVYRAKGANKLYDPDETPEATPIEKTKGSGPAKKTEGFVP